MIIPINFGAGGGSGSDDCTAQATDVLTGKTAIFLGTDDEPENGSMADYSGTTAAADVSLDAGNLRLQLTIPYTGKYDTGAKLYSTYSQVRTLIGYTDASKVLAGTTFLGLAGTMSDRSGTTQTATASLNNSYLRLQIPNNGYYNTSAYLQQSYSNIASLIGLTAAKIKYGETILGITGTWNGYVATSTDLYYGGAVGTLGGSISIIVSGSNLSVTLDTSCIVISQNNSTANAEYFGIAFANAINTGAYSKLTMTFTMVAVPTHANPIIYIGAYTSRPSGNSSLNPSSALLSASRTLNTCTAGSSYTLSIDLSAVSQNLYIGAGAYSWSQSNSAFVINITRIQLS